jgi:hypothetical protein
MNKLTDSKPKSVGIVALSSALSVLLLTVIEKNFGIDGSSPVYVASLTVIFHAILMFLGVTEEPIVLSSKQPTQNQASPSC